MRGIECSKCKNIYEITQINNKNKFLDENIKNEDDGDENYMAMYICRICGNTSKIIPETKIITRPSNDIIKKYYPINKNKINDPTYPVTRNYICPNKECESHKNIKKKEAIFYRIPSTYEIQYICKICETVWNNS